MALKIAILPVLESNYIYMLEETESGLHAVVDPALAQPVKQWLEAKGAKLDVIFNTHHHGDHVGGNKALKRAWPEVKIVGAAKDAARIPGIEVGLEEGQHVMFGAHNVQVLETPGHTLGAIVFYMEQAGVAFVGDTLFTMGCGRLFEGSPAQMWESLQKLNRLPAQTQLYSAHEYALANGRFALSVEPENEALQARVQEVARAKEEGRPMQPTTLAKERATNPFLRARTLEDFTCRRQKKDVA